MGKTVARERVSLKHLRQTGDLFLTTVALLFYVHGKHLRSCRDGNFFLTTVDMHCKKENVDVTVKYLVGCLFICRYFLQA